MRPGTCRSSRRARWAGAIFRDLAAQNVRYVELSFDIVRVLERRAEIADVVAAVKGAAPPGQVVRVFAAFSQHKPDRTPPTRSPRRDVAVS
jgi:chorismate mutase